MSNSGEKSLPWEGAGKELDYRNLDQSLVVPGLNAPIYAADILHIALRASAAILDVYNLCSDEWDIQFKEEGKGPLTVADLRANEIICTGLEELYGDVIPIISEENKEATWAERKKYEHFWLVDPLDGTKEFIRRNGQFTVNIALCRGKDPILGVVTAPTRGIAYIGVENGGSFKLVPGKSLQLLQTTPFLLSDRGLRIVASSSHNSPETVEFIKKFSDPRVVLIGSSLKILMLAEEQADVYPRFSLCSEWDTAAAHAVLRFAGGDIYTVVKSDIGLRISINPLIYHKNKLLNPFFVAIRNREALKSSSAFLALEESIAAAK